MRRLSIVLLVAMVWLGRPEPVSAAALPSCVDPDEVQTSLVAIESKSLEGAAVSVTAYLMKPLGEGPFPAVVLLHGSIGGLQPGYLCIAAKIVGWGYVALVIDSNSAPSRNRAYSLGSFLDTEQGQDAHQGRAFLMALPFVQGDRVGVIGWSAGGRAALAAISSNESLYNGEWYGVDRSGSFAAAVALYPICYDQLENPDAALLILVGARDAIASARQCEDMARVGRAEHDTEIRVYPDSEHGFDRPWSGWTRGGNAAANARQGIREFLARHLLRADRNR